MRNRLREISHRTLVLSEWSTAQKLKRILHSCYCSAVTHLADVSPSCACASVTRVRIQDPGCKHSTAALQMWQGTAELCPERSSLEGDAIKVLPLNPLAVLAQRSEQVHTWGEWETASTTRREQRWQRYTGIQNILLQIAVSYWENRLEMHTLNAPHLRVTRALFHSMYRLQQTRMNSIRWQISNQLHSLKPWIPK